MATVTSPRRAAPAHPRTPSRPSAPTRPPRRVSGPTRGRAAAAASPRESLALGERALALVRGLPDHSLIDRLVRGRAWIPVLGVLLAGIVAMQVEILKLGASTGRAVEQAATLQTRNEALQANVAGLADDQRIERIAAAQGMVMPSPDSLVFLTARPGAQVGRALSNIQAPDPSGFTSQLAAEAAAAAALMPAAPASTASSTSGTSTGSATATSGTTTTIPTTVTSPATPAAATAASGQTTTSGQTTAPSATGSGSAATPAPTTGAVSAPAATPTGAAGIAPAASSQSSGG
jgi:cell division protein FtsL